MAKNPKQEGAESSGPGHSAESGATLDPDIQLVIGKRLQQLYDGVLDEPIPDRFLDLLKQLDEAKGAKNKD